MSAKKTESAASKELKNIYAKRLKNKKGEIRIDSAPPERVMSDKKKASAALLASQTKNQPIEVVLNGKEPVSVTKGSENTVYMPMSLYYGWKIMIPVDDFFANSIIAEDERDKALSDSIGMKFDIIPTKFFADNDKKLCLASRKMAMDVRRKEYWEATNEVDGKVDYWIKPGQIARARVIQVFKGSIRVELFGVESMILAKDISYTRIDTCKGLYKPGDEVKIRIKDVKRDGDHISFDASVKEAYADPRIEEFKIYVEQGLYKGTVTMINTNPGVDKTARAFVRPFGSSIDIICNYPNKILPEIGDEVTFVVLKKNPETLGILGQIKHVWISSSERTGRDRTKI